MKNKILSIIALVTVMLLLSAFGTTTTFAQNCVNGRTDTGAACFTGPAISNGPVSCGTSGADPTTCIPTGFNTSAGNVSCSAAGADPNTCIPSGSAAATPSTVSNTATAPAANGTCPNGGTTGSGGGCNLGYTPLEPIPGVNTSINLVQPNNLHVIIDAIFKILITAGALLAVLSLTIGGVQYMVSGSAGGKNAGIKRAQASLWAILLIAGSWLILNTINPALLNFSLNPCPNPANCTVVSAANTTNGSSVTGTTNSSNSLSLQGTTAVGPATLGTATGDQMKEVNSELGLTGGLTGGGVVSDKVLIYNPSDQSAANTAAINSYIDYCENSGIISTGSFGLIHYNVQPAYGGTFNAPGQNALVCVSN